MNTIVQVLIANGHADLITHAVICDLTTPVNKLPESLPYEVSVRVLKDQGYEPVSAEKRKDSWVYLRGEVIEHNRFKTKKAYLVRRYDGSTDWVDAENQRTTYEIQRIAEEVTA